MHVLHNALDCVVEDEAGHAGVDGRSAVGTLDLAQHPSQNAGVAERVRAVERHRAHVQLAADAADELVLKHLLHRIHPLLLRLQVLQLSKFIYETLHYIIIRCFIQCIYPH